MKLIRRKGVAIVQFKKGILVVSGKTKIFHLPGGGANKGESRKKATIRELYEETGLKTKKIKYLFSYKGKSWHNYNGRLVKNSVKVFLVEPIGKPKPRKEIKRIMFWNPEKKLRIGESTLNSIKKYLAKPIK